MSRVLLAEAWMVLVWAALWENYTVGTIAAGVIVGSLVVSRIPTHTVASPVGFRLFGFLRLVGYFVWTLFISSMQVVWQILTPKPGVPSGIVAVNIRGSTEGLVSIVAMLISLTPGTLALEVDPAGSTIYIHVLRLKDIAEVRAEIRHLEDVVEGAFPVVRQTRPDDRTGPIDREFK